MEFRQYGTSLSMHTRTQESNQKLCKMSGCLCNYCSWSQKSSPHLHKKNNSQFNDNRVSPEYKTNVIFTTVENECKLEKVY